MDNFQELYFAAAGRQDELRDGAFLDLPLNLCGFPCAPLTARRFAVLVASRSPFLCGGFPMPAHVAQFLWALHPNFSFTNTIERDAFIESCGCVVYASAVEEIKAFVEDCFMDSPQSSETKSESYNSWIASIVDVLAREYGWTQPEVLDLPMASLFQYIRLISRRNNPNVPEFNKFTDGVKNTLLNQLNAKPEAT